MDRPNKLYGNGLQDFIIFDDNESRYFKPDTPKPIVLSLAEAVHHARHLVPAAALKYAEGYGQVTDAETAMESTGDTQDTLFQFQSIQGHTNMEISDEMITFVAQILAHCDPEIRLGLFPVE